MPALPADQRALLAAVIAAPDDDTPRLVYADWLDEHCDDVQANYIRESVRLARLPAGDPERPGLERRLTSVLEDNANEWAIALGCAPAATGMCYRRGFVHTIRYHRLDDCLRDGPAWFRSAPIQGLSLDSYVNGAAWRTLLQNPMLGRLRRLDVSGCRWTDEELRDLAKQPHLTRLEVLDLGDVPDDEVWVGLSEVVRSRHLTGLRAVYFGDPATPGPDFGVPRAWLFLTRRFNKRFGDRWGNRRPPPPVWC
ncbi:MAG: TIGR02996 domain-containing protein [Gemmataceae bacterium]|nr:TIGR02996 domain-containing protein [Gemmataceae bacterium]